MAAYRIDEKALAAFEADLWENERSGATVEKYLREVRRFAAWLGGAPVLRSRVSQYKDFLLAQNYSPATVNGKLSAIDSFLGQAGLTDCRVRHLRLQRRLFRDNSRELKREEYERLVATAAALGKRRLALTLETVCATGIRVSELAFITVEALRQGRAEVSLKGKIRTVLLPGKLRKKLLRYAREKKIASGKVFVTRSGKGVSRQQIWAEMKGLCRKAGVEAGKVFPHNLRHLFARSFYKVCRDIVRLADVLGHSSVETTRIYLISTGIEHVRTLARLRLVS